MNRYLAILTLTLACIIGLNAQDNYSATGLASYYADKFEGRKTASGEIYRHSDLTAAHPSLPFGTMLKVTNLNNNKSVIVRVNDRGPFVKGRIIDVSKSAAIRLEAINDGIVKVTVEKTNNTAQDLSISQTKNSYYQIDVRSKKLSGYGVQIGSFSQMDNLIRLSDAIRKENSGDVFVSVASVKGKIVNRLIVGVEANKPAAERNRKALKKEFPDCFVVRL
jgi:rare lipoprotein A